MKDIENLDDIKVFVNGFYDKVRKDKILAPIFSSRIPGEAWEKHLNRMYDFWNAVLFFQKTYKGNPFIKHIGLNIDIAHFNRWLILFKTTIDENFSGRRADEIKIRVEKMAALFILKLEEIRKNPDKYQIV